MSNISVEHVIEENVLLKDYSVKDEEITFSAAGTYKRGTLLARDSVTKKLIPFVVGGTTNSNGIPVAVLVKELVATSATDKIAAVCVKGYVRQPLLVIHADGDGSNIDALVIDALRDMSIFVEDNTDHSILEY